MTTRRLAILLAVVAGTFSVIFFLPHQLDHQPVGIVLQLPEYQGIWWGKDGLVTEKERLTLGPDTEFARKDYESGTGEWIHASIVLAGQDMMTGIHRPERCLYAQGWTTGSSTIEKIQVPAFGDVRATRLHIYRKDNRMPPDGDPAKVGTIRSLCYYMFVGYNELAATHNERVFLDIKDRLISGYNQRWAMVMISSEITKEALRFGKSEAETDKALREFAAQLLPKIVVPETKSQTAASSLLANPVEIARQ